MLHQELNQSFTENFAWYLYGGPTYGGHGLVLSALLGVVVAAITVFFYRIGVPASSRKKRKLTRMSSAIGRFSLRSQTLINPSIITFFIALANPPKMKEFDHHDLREIIERRVLTKHERFGYCVDEDDDRYFELMDDIAIDRLIIHNSHKNNAHLVDRIEAYSTDELNVHQQLWEAQVSTGPMGASNAIPFHRLPSLDEQQYKNESVAIFRVHHALCDGVSLSVAVGDMCDEAQKLQDTIHAEIQVQHDRERTKSLIRRMRDMIGCVLYFTVGTVVALTLWIWRCCTSVNPFDKIVAASGEDNVARSTAWRHVASVNQVKQIGKLTAKSITVNDLMVTCITAAIRKQLQFHHRILNHIIIPEPSHLNVVVPIHLTGGVLMPGESLGNKIGAFVAAIPTGDVHNPAQRLKKVSKSLLGGKRTPAALISWTLAKLLSEFAPRRFSKWALRNGNAHSVAVISNVRGFPFKTHWAGRPVEAVMAFLPLPPGIPIGIVVQSYDGDLYFTVEADRRAVPDADIFADWILQEYDLLKEVTNAKAENIDSVPSLIISQDHS